MLSHEFKVQEGVYLRGLGVIGVEKKKKMLAQLVCSLCELSDDFQLLP